MNDRHIGSSPPVYSAPDAHQHGTGWTLAEPASDEYCPVCPERKRIPRRPPVCDADRAWPPNALADLAGLARQLAERDHAAGDYRVAPYREAQQYDQDGRRLPRLAARDEDGALLLRRVHRLDT